MPDLFTLYELASYLQQDLDTATADQARTTATNYLRRELGVEFDEAPRVLIERVSPTVSYRQLRGPLVSVESVTVNGTELVYGEDYDRTSRGIACPDGFGDKVGDGWAWVDLVVAYTAGFAAIPADLHDAGLFLAGLSYLRGTRPGVTGSTITVEGVSETQTYAPGDTDTAGAVALDEATLSDLRHAYGSGRTLAGSARIR